MNELLGVRIDSKYSEDSKYFKWKLLDDLKNGHYTRNDQSRPRYVHHLAII